MKFTHLSKIGRGVRTPLCHFPITSKVTNMFELATTAPLSAYLAQPLIFFFKVVFGYVLIEITRLTPVKLDSPRSNRPKKTPCLNNSASGVDRKSTRLNSSHLKLSRMPSSA